MNVLTRYMYSLTLSDTFSFRLEKLGCVWTSNFYIKYTVLSFLRFYFLNKIKFYHLSADSLFFLVFRYLV